MIDRYSLPEIANIFSDESRFARYLEIELLATEAQSQLGVVPSADAKECRARAPTSQNEPGRAHLLHEYQLAMLCRHMPAQFL